MIEACKEDCKALTDLVKQNTRNAICIEIGSYTGTTAKAILKGGASLVYCIDDWQGRADNNGNWLIGAEYGREVYQQFVNNLKNHIPDKCIPLVGTSKFWASIWNIWNVDLIFIDADHDYKVVKEDINNWSKFIKKGGIICGHDFDNYEPHIGVKKAVMETGKYNQIGRSIWYREINQ